MKLHLTNSFAFYVLSLLFFLCTTHVSQAQISGQANVCVADLENYTTSLSGTLTWSVTPAGPGITPSGSSALVNWAASAGAYTLSATNGTSTETYTVNVYAIPVPQIQYTPNACNDDTSSGGPTGDIICDTFCVGEIVTYTVAFTPGNSYNWTITGGTIISGAGTNQVQVIWNTSSGSECGFLNITESTPGGCSGSDFTRGVAAYPNGTISISAVPSPVCLGSPISFTANTTGGPFVSYTWDFGDNSNLVTLSTNTTSYTYASSGTFNVIVTAQTECCSTSDTIQVIVDSLPGPDIYCISSVCSDQTNAQYCTSATGCTYTWSVTGGTIVSGAGTSCITVNWGTGPTGTISLTTSGCSPALCPATTTVTVPIMPSGSFSISGPLVVCLNSSGIYSAPYIPGAQYTWTLIDPASVSSVLPYNVPPYIQNITFTQVGTYTLICNMVNDVLECEGSDTIYINVLPDFVIFGSTTLCEGSMGSFSSYDNSIPGFISSTWTTTAPGNVTQTGTTANFIFSAAGTYTVTATNPAYCNSPQTITVVVNPNPATPVISGNTSLCPGGTYSFSTSGYSVGAMYFWTFTDNLFNFTTGSGNPFTITTVPGFTSGTISLTVTENGCSATTSIPVTAPAVPAPVFTGNTTVCPDAVETYTASLSYPGVSNVTWSISPAAAGTIISGQGTGTAQIEWHSVSPNALQNVVITISETICNTFTGTYTLNVAILPLPVITASGSNFCPGTSTTLTATGGVSYQWFNASNNPVSPTITAPGSYYVIGTDASGCTAKDYVTVTSLAQPVASISTPDVVVCDTNGVMQNTINLYALNNTGYTYLWLPSGNTANPEPVSTTGNYAVIVTGPNGCKDTAIFQVACLPTDSCILPACACVNNPATVVQGTVNCNDFTFTANSTCSGTAVWSFGDGFLGAGNSVNHTYTSAGYYIVCYANTDPGCCPPAPACTTVAVPVAADFDVLMVCNTLTVFDNSSFLPPYNITGWSWDYGDFTTASGQNPPPHTYTSAGPFTVTLTVTTASGCQATFSQVVNTAGPFVSASFSSTACNGPVAFTGNVLSGTIVNWQWDFGDTYGSNSQNPSHIYAGPGTYLVSVTGTNASGCTHTDTGSITILAPPPAFTLIYTSPACGSTTLSVPSPGNYTSFQWLNNGTPISGATNSTYVATQSGNYSVEVIDLNGCLLTSNVANVIINPQPNIFITVPSPLCDGDAFTIQTNTSPSFSFTWDIDGFAYFSGNTLTINPYGLSPGSHTVTVIAFDVSTGCADTAALTFFINASPTVSIINSDPTGVCSGDSIQLTAVSGTAISYLWNTSSVSTSIYVLSTGTYSVTVTDINGCMASASTLATIHPLPDLSMLPIGCDSACINPNQDTINGPPGMASYSWEINNVVVSTNQNLYLNMLNMPVFGVPYTVCLTATTINGCVDSTCFEYTPIDCDSSECFDVEDTVYCDSDSSFTLELIITNNNSQNSTFLWLHDVNTPFTVSPSFVPLTLLPGQTSSPITFTVTYPSSGSLPSDLCYQLSLYSTDSCCHDSTEYCIPVPVCDPCDSISVSADSTEGCCKDISITNNYSGSYFTAVQVTPITAGASIASAILGFPYLGTWTAMGTSAQMTFTPNAGNVPLGTTAGLVNICLNLAPSTPSPQVVLVNWFTTGIDGQDSIACTDTVLFYCEAPEINPCGEIIGEIECHDDGTYHYYYTFTNNDPTHTVTMLMFTSISPAVTIIPNPVVLGTPVLPGNSYSGSVLINPGSYPPGTTFCFDLTLADTTGWCCHEMDSICLTLPDCDSCECGEWEPFTIIDESGGEINTYEVECGQNYSTNTYGLITFTSGGFTCPVDTCPPSLSWNVTGPVSSSGTGLPSFPTSVAGVYTLTMYGYCGGNLCDSCVITFTVEEEICECGEWEPIVVSTVVGLTEIFHDVFCGQTITTQQGAIIDFTSGAYSCIGDSGCDSSLTWNLSGPVSASGTGLPSFTAVSAGVYTVTVYGYCGGNLCDSCVITFVVEEDCECGEWEMFSVLEQTDTSVNTYDVECGQNYVTNTLGIITFTGGGYTCAGDATICTASLEWNVTGPISASGTGLPSFSTSTAGVYTLTMYGYCGGNLCDSCVITFVVEEDCECGGWKMFTITDESGGDIITYDAACGQNYFTDAYGLITFTGGGYTCYGDPAVCTSSLTWNVTGPITASGTGLPSFATTTAGVYTLTIYGYCGGNLCDSCIIKFTIEDEICECGGWGLFTVSKPTKSYTDQPCGSMYTWRKDVPVTINGNYTCTGSCTATYAWTVYRNSVLYASGTGMPVNFTPTLTGNYAVYITASCGGLDCGTCIFKFKVKTPPPGRMDDTDANLTMRLSPNPANENITIELVTVYDDAGTIMIINELGVIVKTENVFLAKGQNAIVMEIADLPAGCYLVHFAGSGESQINRLIIAK